MDSILVATVALVFLGAGLAVGLYLRHLALGEVARNREAVRAEVEALAGRLLEAKGEALVERSQAGLKALLDPLGERIRGFEARVERTHDAENRDRARLLEALRQLQEAQARLHEDAEALSRALTGDSKAQGDWGEVVLERLLETAGLTEGREYALQASHVDGEGGRKRPDALVFLPGDRVVVVDAKWRCSARPPSGASRSNGSPTASTPIRRARSPAPSPGTWRCRPCAGSAGDARPPGGAARSVARPRAARPRRLLGRRRLGPRRPPRRRERPAPARSAPARRARRACAPCR